MSGKAFTPSPVCGEPLIFTGCAMKSPKANPARTKGTTVPDNAPPLEFIEHKGELLICDLWQNRTDIVHDMRVVNTYANSHSAKTPEKCLHEADRTKKKMYLEACLQQRIHFYPFFASVNELLGVEAEATLKMIASRLATKWRKH